MKPTRKRLLTAVLGWAAAFGGLTCAEGTRSEPEVEIVPPAPFIEPTCGNGKPDPGEQCECPNQMTTTFCPITTMNCASLGMGYTGGTLLCNAKPKCTFNTMMCTGGPPTGGTGGSGR